MKDRYVRESFDRDDMDSKTRRNACLAGSTWVHKKTGGVYTVLETGRIEHNLEEVVIYRGSSGVWVRPFEEFIDGRFSVMSFPDRKYKEFALQNPIEDLLRNELEEERQSRKFAQKVSLLFRKGQDRLKGLIRDWAKHKDCPSVLSKRMLNALECL